MKKTFIRKAALAAISAVVLAFAGCSAEYDDSYLREQLDDHEERLAALEEWKNNVNSNIASLQEIVAALEDSRQVESVTEFTTPEPGGWTITFSSGSPASINIYNGAKGDKGDTGDKGETGDKGDKGDTGDAGSGNTPQIGVEEFPAGSGVYYWTLDGEFIEVDGEKMPVTGDKGDDGADGITPKMRIDENGYWEISYDGGKTYEPTGVKATGQAGQDGEDGEDGEDGADGQDGITPLIRVGSTGYWEISYDGGVTYTSTGVKATGQTGQDGEDGEDGEDGADGQDGSDGITPLLDIDDDTNEWLISYDNGNTWTGLGIVATGADGEDGEDGQDGSANAIFSGVDNSNEDYVIFTLTGGGEIQLPRYKSIGITFTQPDGITQNTSEDVPFSVTGEATIVKVLDVPADWKVKTTFDAGTGEGKFTITAPTAYNFDNMSGEAIILVSDGEDRTVMRVLQFGAVVSSLAIQTGPTQTIYGIGEPFNPSGMVVNVVFEGGGSQPVAYTADNFEYDFSVAGARSVVVSAYGVSKTFGVTVQTLAQRIAAAPADGVAKTIKLFADEDIVSTITVPANKSIDLQSSSDAMRTLYLTAVGRMFTINSGGVLMLNNNITLDGARVETNNAPMVYVNGGTLYLLGNAMITRNNNASGNGGGIYLGAGSTFMMLGGNIVDNVALNGGGIYQTSGNSVTLLGGTIHDNGAVNGGGVYVASGTMSPSFDCTISANYASGLGGGVYVAAGATLNASSSIIKGNNADGNATLIGIDVYVHCSGINVGNITIGDNTQIGNLALFANSSVNCKITMSLDTYDNTAPMIESLDLRGDDPQLANVKTMWLNKVVLVLPGGTISSTTMNRIELGRFWNGSMPYESELIYNPKVFPVSKRITISPATGKLYIPAQVSV